MKRKFIIIKKETKGNEEENDENDEGEEEEGEIDAEQGEEKHPPPPKKARLSTDAEEQHNVDNRTTDASLNVEPIPSKNSVKTEPCEPEVNLRTLESHRTFIAHQQQPSNSVKARGEIIDDERAAEFECKVEVLPVPSSSSSVAILSPPPLPPVLSPRTVDVSTASSFPDNHPTPVLVSNCSHCADTHSLRIEIPFELISYFKRASENGAFQSLLESVPNILVKLEGTESLLVVKSFSSVAIEKVHMLADAFVENSRQRQKMLRKREDNSKWSFANFESNMLDANFLVEIEVSLAYTGLAFGKNRSNLATARALYGIREITVDESQKQLGICKFKIYANTVEAADRARKMLEFTDRKMAVPVNAVGRLIGKHSRNINDIVSKSGVVRIFVEKAKVENEPTRNFVLIGTPETIANAEMMLHFHLRHIHERDNFDEERDELERECALEKSTMLDAPASSAGHRNYDNTAFDHWTSLAVTAPVESIRTNNSRLPWPIFGHPRRQFGCSGPSRVGGGRRNEVPPICTATSNGPMPSLQSDEQCYYQQPLAPMRDNRSSQFSAGRWTDFVADSETMSKSTLRAGSKQQPLQCYERRGSNRQRH